ncbi:MAG TPA: hypothetical protein VF753_14395 [Terriglobales bacterium]
MKKPFRKPRKSVQVPDFDHRLAMYALAASAAGVGVVATAQSAEGKIVYTKTDKEIGDNQALYIDLNHDGIFDFKLKNTLTTSTAGGAFDHLVAGPAKKGDSNEVWGHTVPFGIYASALQAGMQIGPKGEFIKSAGLMAAYSISGGVHAGGARRAGPDGNYSCTGPWANVQNRFLGFKFQVKGETHFGWARVSVVCSGVTVTATLTGFAYETVANQPIRAGKETGPDEAEAQPVTLGKLAVGAGYVQSGK